MHKKALLLVNLGSPDSTSVPDVRSYLAEFLMDKYVIDVPFLVRVLIVYGFILPFRPKKSAEAYASIWWDEGSPLIVLSRRLEALVRDAVNMPVALGMRYGNPSIEAALQELQTAHPDLEEIILFPLYPHDAMATVTTVVEKTKAVLKSSYPNMRLKCVAPFYNYPTYIDALAQSIKKQYDEQRCDHLLFSFHGVPERHVKKTDFTGNHCMNVNNCCYVKSDAHRTCYSHHVHTSARLVMAQLGLTDQEATIAFQSRLGRDRWLSPATDATIEQLAKSGVKRLAVACPAFVSDCLETLEEIGEEGKEIFLEHGGESFTLIPCLNEDPNWIKVIQQLVSDEGMHTVIPSPAETLASLKRTF